MSRNLHFHPGVMSRLTKTVIDVREALRLLAEHERARTTQLAEFRAIWTAASLPSTARVWTVKRCAHNSGGTLNSIRKSVQEARWQLTVCGNERSIEHVRPRLSSEPAMILTLRPEIDRHVTNLVRDGVYPNAEAVLVDAVKALVREQERRQIESL